MAENCGLYITKNETSNIGKSDVKCNTTDNFPISCLRFSLTSRCNMSCRHCYNDSGTHNNLSDAMTPQRWIDFSKYIVQHGGVLECLLSGGEPFLLGNTLFEIMDILSDDGTLFLLTTNGYFLNKENVSLLRKYCYHWLQISIDGRHASYHDSFRRLSGSWKKAVKGARMVAESGIPLKIAHCVTPYNIHEIDDMCKFAYQLGATSIIIGEACLSGRAAHNRDILLSSEQKVLLHQKFEENFSKYEGRMIVKTSHTVRSGLEKHINAPMSKAVIRPNGDIRLDDMAPFIVGNVLKDDFATIWRNKIKTSWETPEMKNYIQNFDKEDKNHSLVNYVVQDIALD